MGKFENYIERKLCNGVRALGGKAYKLISPGCSGMPDRLVCLPTGDVFFAELKSPDGRLGKMQEHRIAELRELGQWVVVLHSAAEVESFLRNVRELIAEAERGDAE